MPETRNKSGSDKRGECVAVKPGASHASLIKEIIPPMAMLGGEKEAEFKELERRAYENLKPCDVIEEVLVMDFIRAVWEVMRYTRLRDAFLALHRIEGTRRAVSVAQGEAAYSLDAEAKRLALDMVSNDQVAFKSAKRRLDELSVGEAEISTMALSLNSKRLKDFEDLIDRANRRKNDALRELRRHRVDLARRAKEFEKRQIVDAQFEDVA